MGEWQNVVENWYFIEKACEADRSLKVSSYPNTSSRISRSSEMQGPFDLEGAPKVVVAWAKKGNRSLEKPPKISNVLDYGEHWRSWWSRLQPEWRLKVRGGKPWPLKRGPIPEDEGWEGLLRFGENGFHILLLSLVWWFSSIPSPKERRQWILAVDDVSWVLKLALRCIED